MNFDTIYLEIYTDLVMGGMDPDEAECIASDEAEMAMEEYREDKLHGRDL